MRGEPLRPQPKGARRATVTRRKQRAESAVIQRVRLACAERDGYCRIGSPYSIPADQFDASVSWAKECSGPSQLCHMHVRKRSQTRNQAPEIRHDTRYCFMACQRHHDQYDGRARPRLIVTALTRKWAWGRLKFRRTS